MRVNDGRIRRGQHLSPRTEFTRERVLGEKNPKWKGDGVGYDALHGWVRRTLGDPLRCSDCGSSENLEWANVSRKYKRVSSDWIGLCASCHDLFDGIAKLTRDQAAEIRLRYAEGQTQKFLGKKFGVHQSQISRIVNRKVICYG